MANEAYHTPVLLRESIDGLDIKAGGSYVDATFGGGGHSREILKRLGNGKLFGFDQDAEAEKNKIDDRRFFFINQNFRYLKKFLKLNGVNNVDGILADLGISSYQIDTAERGFSTRFEGPLDMRMDRSFSATAANILNTYEEKELVRVFSDYGEVRNSKTLASAVVEERGKNKLKTIADLKAILEKKAMGNTNRYFAQVFQALRIEVNNELDALKEFLKQSLEVLKPGGRLVVISYHSLEDRRVKDFMRAGNFTGEVEKDNFGNQTKYFRLITKKPVAADEGEVNQNKRSRSARLRIAEKL
jgi:16S rRNA (cytosine1402-N4)-methyltransferase